MLSNSDTRETGNECAEFGLEEKFQALLEEMLVGVRHHRETTLLAGFDSYAIVVAALRSLSTWGPQAALSGLPDSDAVEAIFNQVAKRTVQDHPDQPDDLKASICLPSVGQGSRTLATTVQQRAEEVTQWLAAWLKQFCMNMNEVHPKSIEVVILRAEGCDNREVAQRLALTLRLVKRIAGDIQRACECVTKG